MAGSHTHSHSPGRASELYSLLRQGGGLADIDRQFADLIARLAPGHDLLTASAALASRERGRGHSCLDLKAWAGRRLPGDGKVQLPRLPRLSSWRQTLADSPLVQSATISATASAAPTTPTAPLVLDGDRLYLYRYWQAEQRLAAKLEKRLDLAAPLPVDDALRTLFAELFPTASTEVDDQAIAAAIALANPVAIISGGPGTGKTTTVTRVLALLAAAHGDDLRIHLAAPTGKAAARLSESISEQMAKIELPDSVRSQVPAQASTLHRLLGYQPDRESFRRRADTPLGSDLLVVDEASMVDLLLMDALVDALPDHCRLILLGDRDQLASVETGSVFGDICTAAGLGSHARSAAFRHYSADLGVRLEKPQPDMAAETATDSVADSDMLQPNRWRDVAVELRISYRFLQHPDIGTVATAIRQRDLSALLSCLAATSDDVSRQSHPSRASALLEPIMPSIDAYLACQGAAEALAQLARFRLLCATRVGPWGTERLNALVEAHLQQQRRETLERWYAGRPILIRTNDYQVGLFNGDLGVCWPQDGRLWAFFADPDGANPDRANPDSANPDSGSLRRLPLAKLPQHDTAWAMTVHKSQGSEFDHVLLVLPGRDLPIVTRELLYTGITRARRRVDLVAGDTVLEAALARSSRRASGLAAALLGQPLR